jgi:hypothetical protein
MVVLFVVVGWLMLVVAVAAAVVSGSNGLWGWLVVASGGDGGGCGQWCWGWQWHWRRTYAKDSVTPLHVNFSYGEVLLSSGHTTNNLGNSA